MGSFKQYHRARPGFIFTALLLLILQGRVAYADAEGFWQKSSVTLDITYASQYIGRRGVSFFGDGPALHPNVQVDMGATGWYAGIWGAYSLEDGCRDPFGDLCSDWLEYDYYFGYGRSVWASEPFATTYDFNYTLLTYPRQDSQDEQEVGLSISHPNLLPLTGWSRPVLYWGLYYLWPVDNAQKKDRREVTIGLSYDIPVNTQKISIFGDLLWASRAGGKIEGDGIMRYKGGLSTTFMVQGFGLKPTLYYQSAVKKTDPGDWIKSEFWFKMSVSVKL